MRIFVTGITGFVGSHLAQYLLGSHPEVSIHALRRWRSGIDDVVAQAPAVRLFEGDLMDAPSLLRALAASRPQAVLHLAASSSVAGSWGTPAETMQVNVLGTLNLLEAIRQLDLDAIVVLACSAEAYGLVQPRELPIREEQPFRPVSPYAVSKAATDLLGFQYHQTYRLRTVRLRPFNHCGPGQSDRFVVADFARQIAEIEVGLRPPQMRVGNLNVRRDFVDVRDIARAYFLAATMAEAGQAYNVSTGLAWSIREVLDHLLTLTDAVIDVAVDPTRLRPSEITVLQGDSSRFRAVSGWQPAVTFERMLADVLDFWRGRVRGLG